MNDLFFIYGPPRSGKTTLGQELARRLDGPFQDLDALVAERAGRPVASVLATEGESGFRALESECLKQIVATGRGVVALGPGSLLAPLNRGMAEDAGTVLCLGVQDDALESRPDTRDAAARAAAERLTPTPAHYASFARKLPIEDAPPATMADAAQIALGAFRVSGMGAPYDVRVGDDLLERIGPACQANDWQGRVILAGDANTLPLHGPRVEEALAEAGLDVHRCVIPAGEATKTIDTVQALWRAFLDAKIERRDTVVALGGGVVGDLTGFAAATWLRGVRWIGLPTSLLAMVDSSLGGKTGADLPQGKNLIGAFHPPALVLADTETLATLSDDEFRSGLAEVVKHGLIADPELFDLCAEGFDSLRSDLPADFVSRAMADKIRTIEQDPYEKGIRAALNLGHTVGHGIEKAMGFTLRHGEAVSIGMVVEARIAERMGLAHAGLADLIVGVLARLGLPTALPARLDRKATLDAIQLDKKRAGGVVRFALPVRIGEVRTGVAVETALLAEVLDTCRA